MEELRIKLNILETLNKNPTSSTLLDDLSSNMNMDEEHIQNLIKKINDEFPEAIRIYELNPVQYSPGKDHEIALNKMRALYKEIDEFRMHNIEILNLLDEPELDRQYLHLGMTKDPEEFWYYGFEMSGKEAVITSKGRVLRNTEERFRDRIVGENEIIKYFDYGSSYIGDIAPTISRKNIKRFMEAEGKTIVNPKELYAKIRDKILHYMDFGEQIEIADVEACWILDTYVYPMFDWFAHLFMNAPRESGKTKNAFIITELSFCGFDLGAAAGVTPAQMYRTIEGNRGTMLIDEFETARGKMSEDIQRVVYQILNASASRDASVIRNDSAPNGKSWLPRKFNIFCPKVIANISGMNPVSLSRCICLKWLKTKGEKGKRKPQNRKERDTFAPIRDDCYIFVLENWHRIRDLYENLSVSGLNNRDEDNWKPLIAMARFIDGCPGEPVNAEAQLWKYIKQCEELEIETEDSTEDFFAVLYEKVDEEEKMYQPKEIAEWPQVQEIFSWTKSPAHIVGKILKRYNFKLIRRGGGIKYILSKENVRKIIDLYFKKVTAHTTPNTHNTQTTLTTLQQENPVEYISSCAIGADSVVLANSDMDSLKPEYGAVLSLMGALAYDDGLINLEFLLNNTTDRERMLLIIREMVDYGIIFEPKSGYIKI